MFGLRCATEDGELLIFCSKKGFALRHRWLLEWGMGRKRPSEKMSIDGRWQTGRVTEGWKKQATEKVFYTLFRVLQTAECACWAEQKQGRQEMDRGKYETKEKNVRLSHRHIMKIIWTHKKTGPSDRGRQACHPEWANTEDQGTSIWMGHSSRKQPWQLHWHKWSKSAALW